MTEKKDEIDYEDEESTRRKWTYKNFTLVESLTEDGPQHKRFADKLMGGKQSDAEKLRKFAEWILNKLRLTKNAGYAKGDFDKAFDVLQEKLFGEKINEIKKQRKLVNKDG